MKAGDLVLARDNDGTWREAWLEQHRPYGCSGGRYISDGWYVRWKEIPKPPDYDPYYIPSQGGWKSVNCLKVMS